MRIRQRAMFIVIAGFLGAACGTGPPDATHGTGAQDQSDEPERLAASSDESAHLDESAHIYDGPVWPCAEESRTADGDREALWLANSYAIAVPTLQSAVDHADGVYTGRVISTSAAEGFNSHRFGFVEYELAIDETIKGDRGRDRVTFVLAVCEHESGRAIAMADRPRIGTDEEIMVFLQTFEDHNYLLLDMGAFEVVGDQVRQTDRHEAWLVEVESSDVNRVRDAAAGSTTR